MHRAAMKGLMNTEQADKLAHGHGFVAALDQSGGSTPKALKLYGIAEDAYSGDEQMFDLVHQMRTRIITSPSFDGDRILAAILFEMTMDRDIEGRPTADYLWNVKNVVPILKVDKGLAAEQDGAQVMKPIPGLDDLLARAVGQGHLRHQDALGHQAARRRTRRGGRSAVRGGPPDPGRRPGADHRTRGRHPQPRQGRGRGPAQGRDHRPTSARSATTSR